MRKFQDAYRDAIDSLPRRRLSAEELLKNPPKGARHGGNAWMKGAVAAAILLLCSASTVTAVNYHRSRIRIEQQGYSLTSLNEDTGVPEGIGEYEETGGGAKMRMAAYSTEESGTEGEGYLLKIMEEQREYSSVEDFRRAEQITMALPEPQLLGEEDIKWQIYVAGDGNSVTAVFVGDEERSFMMHQWDTREFTGYAAATSYMGDSANEREITNSQGLSYVVFDSVEGEEVTSTHAVISANGRELCMDFQGYDEATIEGTLNTLDLSVYFAD
ncbi:MAG: hypothetical protein K2N81_08870 [Acetatifactor sp.]|nr:hypothetical protein [Acetatifactor sp.]